MLPTGTRPTEGRLPTTSRLSYCKRELCTRRQRQTYPSPDPPCPSIPVPSPGQGWAGQAGPQRVPRTRGCPAVRPRSESHSLAGTCGRRAGPWAPGGAEACLHPVERTHRPAGPRRKRPTPSCPNHRLPPPPASRFSSRRLGNHSPSG